MGFFESILFGISLAAVPGPIFFELIRRTLTRGFWHGALLAVGEFIGNFLILLLIFSGTSIFLKDQLLQSVLYAVGGGILIWLGVSALRTRKQELETAYNKPGQKGKIEDGSIVVGFIIAITSPIAISLWASFAGSYLLQFPSALIAFINIFLMAFGVMLFFFSLAGVVYYTKHKIEPTHIALMARISGIVLIMFGVSFIYQAVRFFVLGA